MAEFGSKLIGKNYRNCVSWEGLRLRLRVRVVGPRLTGGEVASKVGDRIMKMGLVPYCVESEKSS